MKHSAFIPVMILIASLTACSKTTKIGVTADGPPLAAVDIDEVPDPRPRNEPKSIRGNPPSYVVFNKSYDVLADSKGYLERGVASWYGRKFHGNQTSNGEVFDMLAMTAAHKSLPLPTYVRVTNLENNRQVVVRVNDRGPFHDNRIIDLSYAAAVKLGIEKKGTGFVQIQAITDPSSYRRAGEQTADTPIRKIYIQVGAFNNEINAIRLLDRIRQTDYRASRIASGVHRDKTVYRVQIGPLSSVDEADKLAGYLRQLGITNTRFAVEETGDTAHALQ